MRAALNALCIDNRSGTGRYTAGLLDGAARLRPTGLKLLVFLPTDYTIPQHWLEWEGFEFHLVAARSLPERIAWEQWTLPQLMQTLRVDLLHSPAFIGPVLRPCPIQQVVTVHDLAFQRYPETIPWMRRSYYRWAIPRAMRRATLILSDTNTVAEELRAVGVKTPIVSIHLGVETSRFRPTPSDDDEAILGAYGLRGPYILFVGTQEPRKNLRTLLHAFSAARNHGLAAELVLMGRYGWSIEESIFEQEGVRRIGYVDKSHQPALYRQADALAAPSLYEGFDLPAYEALACGTPVIASDIAVHREVLCDHACYIPALDAAAWAEALRNTANLPRMINVHARDWIDVARETMEAWDEGRGTRD